MSRTRFIVNPQLELPESQGTNSLLKTGATSEVLGKLKKDAFTVFTSFQNKYFKTNSTESHLLTRSDNLLHINFGGINSVVASMKNY